MNKLILSLSAFALISISGLAIANDDAASSATNAQQAQGAAAVSNQDTTGQNATAASPSADQTNQDNATTNAQHKNDDSDSDS